jgi:hypothetical protein
MSPNLERNLAVPAANPKTKRTTKKWLRDTDNAELATDQAMERILMRAAGASMQRRQAIF